LTVSRSQDFEGSLASTPYLPWIVLLFVGSGCAALVYEIVWFQLLQLIIGSSAISLAVLLSTFMGGMCIGSLGLARFVSARPHPLRVYALLEAAIGVWGVLVLFGLPWVGGLYLAIGGPGIAGLLFRGLLCALFLLPPTILMGATLPAIARWVRATPRGVSWLGFFYGGNTAGAVAGCLLAGFYLLRVHDVVFATFAAVGINAVVTVAGLLLARWTPHESMAAEGAVEGNPEGGGGGTMETAAPAGGAGPGEGGAGRFELAPGGRLVLVAIALSGMTALGSEVVWTRLLSLSLGATVYTFSIILAAFLLGIGLGSAAGSAWARSVKDARRALGWCQLGVVAGLAWAAYCATEAIPHWPVDPTLATGEYVRFGFQFDLVRCLVCALPAAFFWGASFPLALAGAASPEQDPGRLVGRVYAANTLGAIVGALAAPLLLIAWLGTQRTQQVLMAMATLSVLLLWVPDFRDDTGKPRWGRAGVLRGAAATVFALILASTIQPVPGLLVAYGRYMAMRLNNGNYGEMVFVGEGMHSSMAVSRLSTGYLNYHNAGKVQASSEPQDMRLQRMLGHMTTIIPENPRSVMVIGCGAGVTAGAVSIDPAVEELTIVEIEPLVPRVVSTYFSEHNFAVVQNPKTTVVTDDARHFLLTTDRTFDAITSDPFDPWVKGAATLYTQEFWEVARERLNPGGVVTVFVQLYESNLAAVKSEVATFLSVFPEGMVFANLHQGQGYDVVMLGQKERTVIDLDRVDERLSRPEYQEVANSLIDVGFYSAAQLFSTFAIRKPEADAWLADAQINRDRNLRLQYLAGLGVNLYEADAIYQDMARYRTFPPGLFTGSPDRLYELEERFYSGG
jgi:spermidine synthase